MRLMKTKRFFYNWTCSKNSSSQGHGANDKEPCGSPNLTSTDVDLRRGVRILPRCEECGRKKSVTRKEVSSPHNPQSWRVWQIAVGKYREAKEAWRLTQENSRFSYVSIGDTEVESSPSQEENLDEKDARLSHLATMLENIADGFEAYLDKDTQTSEDSTQTEVEE